MPQQIGWGDEEKLTADLFRRPINTANRARQIGWGINSNLLYRIKRALMGYNSKVAKEIGQGTETKLLQDILVQVNCEASCTTTSTTTSVAPRINENII